MGGSIILLLPLMSSNGQVAFVAASLALALTSLLTGPIVIRPQVVDFVALFSSTGRWQWLQLNVFAS